MLHILQAAGMLLMTFIHFCLQGVAVHFLFNKKIERNRLILFALINALMRDLPVMTTLKYSLWLNLATYFITMLLTFKFVIRMKYLISALAAAVLFIMNTVVEYINLSILQVSFHGAVEPQKWGASFGYTILMRGTAAFVLLTMVVLIYFFKFRMNIPEDISKKRYIGLAANTVVTLLFILPNMLFVQNSMVHIPTEYLFLNFLCVSLLLILNIYNSTQSGELEILRRETEFQKMYIQTLNDAIDTMRGFKHDHNNMVNAMGGYLALEDYKGLKEYYKQLQNECHTVNSLTTLNENVKADPALYGLLLSKISYAETRNITFYITLLSNLQGVSMRSYDMCKVLGILLDNALEAADTSDKKRVELCVREKHEGVQVEIFNSIAAPVDIDKIFISGYSTKAGHSGFGLWEVKKIIKKYKECSITTTTTDMEFIQQVYIPK